ncbi:aldo/keto reductase [Alkalinema sp. FACHB-956]|uniref:aldo/keto reductase n=1 Tax=Alkalinema sp. FACHB-956 TaxID=2692768 RepID=UPI001681E7B1|nr:aldo/keto reductase [Alkalinema sp. FACHB-956]
MTTLTLTPTLPPIAPLGIGTWAWGDSLFWSYGKDYGAEQVETAFFAAIEAGITLFDTAEVYGLGESERLLGKFLQQTRQPILLATKYMPLPWRFSPNQVRDAVKASLDRLQRDRIDLYQIHQPVSFLISQQTLLDTLAAEVQAGRITALGVSNYSATQMRQAHKILADRGIPLAVNQVPYSLLDRKIETSGVMETAKELGVTILAYSPLAQGLLTGKYSPETAQNPVMGARRLDPRFNPQGLQKIQPLVKLLQKIGENYDCTPAQVALNWLMAQGSVVPIPGAKTANQAQQNAGALGWALTPEEITQIDLMTRSWR